MGWSQTFPNAPTLRNRDQTSEKFGLVPVPPLFFRRFPVTRANLSVPSPALFGGPGTILTLFVPSPHFFSGLGTPHASLFPSVRRCETVLHVLGAGRRFLCTRWGLDGGWCTFIALRGRFCAGLLSGSQGRGCRVLPSRLVFFAGDVRQRLFSLGKAGDASFSAGIAVVASFV